MAKIYQLKRMAIILNRLSGGRCISPDDLTDYVSRTMSLFDDSRSEISLRTIQRDIETIGELFHICITCGPDRKYRITDRGDSADDYESMLLNFELLSSIDADTVLQKYVLSEHRRPAFSVDISDLLFAIRECHPVEFDYTLVRHGGKVVHKKLKPHFLKESQQRWALFRESFGIWNNPSDPVEEIVLKYDKLDGAFVKTLPLHSSQEILSDNSYGLVVRLRLRITNDFVMALLARSRSVEVVSPLHLRQRLHDVYAAALERNS